MSTGFAAQLPPSLSASSSSSSLPSCRLLLLCIIAASPLFPCATLSPLLLPAGGPVSPALPKLPAPMPWASALRVRCVMESTVSSADAAGGITDTAASKGSQTSPWKRHSRGRDSSIRLPPLWSRPHSSACRSMSRPMAVRLQSPRHQVADISAVPQKSSRRCSGTCRCSASFQVLGTVLDRTKYAHAE